jgi:hypothetical protein
MVVVLILYQKLETEIVSVKVIYRKEHVRESGVTGYNGKYGTL